MLKIENNVFNEEVQSGIHSLRQKLGFLRTSNSHRRLQTRINWALNKWKNHINQEEEEDLDMYESDINTEPESEETTEPKSEQTIRFEKETSRLQGIRDQKEAERRMQKEFSKAHRPVYDETYPITHPYVSDIRTECLSALHYRTQQLEAQLFH